MEKVASVLVKDVMAKLGQPVAQVQAEMEVF